ncbi:hypothetical protein TNCT_341281 [Trichonephila clavata]|uniref:Uncharacterized protein n=1 Tax=Trichonephila clavata TaxID=2740835 RepID=A0A8X6F851_TRICU|nr:hypothetical protein TNCT_341281 [Trichonephila clavata]
MGFNRIAIRTPRFIDINPEANNSSEKNEVLQRAIARRSMFIAVPPHRVGGGGDPTDPLKITSNNDCDSD